MQLSGKTVLVVGASSGIGRQVVLALSHRGNNLVITARRKNLLDALAAEVRANGSECLAVASEKAKGLSVFRVVAGQSQP